MPPQEPPVVCSRQQHVSLIESLKDLVIGVLWLPAHLYGCTASTHHKGSPQHATAAVREGNEMCRASGTTIGAGSHSGRI